jgi:iron complex transport system ATP-binding protein
VSVLLSLAGVSVLRGRTRVVDDVSLEVGEGEVVGLLGPNGAGKSTVLRAALGLVPRASGTVRLGELDPASADRTALAKRAALLPERAGTGSGLTVRDVIRTGRFAHLGAFAAETEADRGAVDDAITRLSLQALSGRAFDTLSAGERTRALLARCFAQAAPLFLLDEPTSTLDLGHARALFAAVRTRVQDGGAALVAIHDLGLAAAICDRLVLMRAGHVVASGAPADVLVEATIQEVLGAKARVELTSDEVWVRIPR